MRMISSANLLALLGADASSAARVASIHMTACTRVNRYARNAPVEVRKEAVILYAAWLWQASAQRRNVFGDGPPVNASRAFLLSGARGLLAPWHTPRAGACV